MGDASAGTAVQRPTITVTLAQFMAEQEQRLAPKTCAQYRDVVELLQHHLNGYASDLARAVGAHTCSVPE